METNKVTIKQGFAGDLTIYIVDSDGSAVNLTGATVYFMIKTKKSDADTAALISLYTGSGVTTSSASGGIITVALTRTQTLALTKNVTGECVIRYSASDITHTKDIEVAVVKSVKIGTIS